MFERAALDTGEYGGVEQLRHHFDLALWGGEFPGVFEIFSHEDHAAAWSAEGFMSGGGHDMAVGHRVVEQSAGNESGGMGDIGQQQGPDLVGDATHPSVIPVTGVGGGAGDDQLWPEGHSLLLHFVIVDHTRFLFNLVGNRLVQDSRRVHRGAMRQVTAVRQVETHKGIAGFQAGHQYRHVGLGARMGLYIGIVGIEEVFGAVDGKLLRNVDILAAAIVSFPGISLGIFVGQAGAHGFQYLVADKVFRCNQLESAGLSVQFILDDLENRAIFFHTGLKFWRFNIVEFNEGRSEEQK